MRAFLHRSSVFILLLPLTAALGACDNPVDDHEEHPVGLVILDAQGQQAATVQVGAVAPIISGQLTVGVNASRTYQVHAVGDDGDRLEIDGDELGLEVGSPTQFATATVQGANQVVLTGTGAGSTAVVFTLMHEGHAEFAGSVPLVVTP